MKISKVLLYPIIVAVAFIAIGSLSNNKENERINATCEQQGIEQLPVIDTVVATVYYEEDTFVITKSDIERPGVDGVYRSLDDHILEFLLYSEAKKYKMVPTKESVDKHLQAVQKENNLTRDELYDIFRSAGYSPEEGREQFARLSAISSLIDFRIRSRLIIPKKDIEKFYDENPVWQEPCYKLERAFVPIPKKRDVAKFRKELEQFITTGIGAIQIRWEDSFWMQQDEIAEAWDFIKKMKIAEVQIVQEAAEGFELVKLIDKKGWRKKSLEERYREIVDTLRRPKYEELLSEYKKSLLDAASIVYFETND